MADIWDDHPLQGRIGAISDKQSKELGLSVGDIVAFRIDENVGIMSVYKGKKYMCLYQHDILFKYLPDRA